MLTTDFNYLVNWLYETVKDDYLAEDNRQARELAEKTYKPLKGVISSLWRIFDTHIFEKGKKLIRYGEGFMYVFNGRWFEKVDESVFLEELVRRVLIKLGVQPVYQLEGAKQIARPLLNRLKMTPECAYEPSRRWICFQNGVLDLKTKEFRPQFSIDHVADIVLDFDYDPRANGVLWGIKLKEIIPNSGFRSDFQQFCGSLLADRKEYKNEYICYLHGWGGNGKSVLASAIGNVFGKRYCSSFSLSQIFAKETATLFVVNEMKGKIVNISDDVSAKDISGGNFKSFVSGEGMPGRGVGKGDWKDVTPPMLLCCINTFPDVGDDSEGNHRRQLIIQTTTKQWEGEARDTQLSVKLATNECKQAIFNWIFDGYKKFVGGNANKGEIKLSKEAIEARKQRKEDSSPMRRWANERFFVKAIPVDNRDPRWRKLVDLFDDYKHYCVDNGYSMESNSRKITSMLRSMGIEVKNLNGQGTAACVGTLNIDTDSKGQLINGKR